MIRMLNQNQEKIIKGRKNIELSQVAKDILITGSNRYPVKDNQKYINLIKDSKNCINQR